MAKLKFNQDTVKRGLGVLGVIISTIGSIQENNLLLISGAILAVFSIIMIWGML